MSDVMGEACERKLLRVVIIDDVVEHVNAKTY